MDTIIKDTNRTGSSVVGLESVDILKDTQPNIETAKQLKKSHKADHLKPWQWKKGQSGNPSGRPEGESMKAYIARRLRAMNDEEREEFLEGLDKAEILRQGEGNPHQSSDVTSGGKPIPFMTLDELRNNNSNKQNSEPDKKD